MTYGNFALSGGQINVYAWNGNSLSGSLNREFAVQNNSQLNPSVSIGKLKTGDVLTLNLTNCTYPASNYTNFRVSFWILDTSGTAHYRPYRGNINKPASITYDQTIDTDIDVSDILVGVHNIGTLVCDVDVLLNGKSIIER